jgi:hypothetical protein
MVVLLELLFRTFIPIGHHPFFEIQKEKGFVIGRYNHKNGSKGTKSIGVFGQINAKWRINNHGWSNEIDYKYIPEDSNIIRVAVIGDSYVEALNLDYDKSFIALLNHQLKGKYEFYSFGIGGSPLSQYLHFCRYVDEMYHPDAFVFVMANNDIDESLAEFGDYRNLLLSPNDSGGFNEHHPEFFELPEDKLNNLAKRSAISRYLYYNLQISRIIRLLRINDKNKQAPQPVVNMKEIQSTDSTIQKVSEYIMEQIKTTTKARQVIFIHDANRDFIYKNKPKDEKLAEVVEIIQHNASKLDFKMIDLHPIFEEDYQINEKKFNYFADYHWNAYGHQIIADTLIEIITTDFKIE